MSAIQVFLHSQKKIDKVKIFLDYLISKFQSSYYPSVVDETMVGFRGRISAKQYIPKKPEKWGIKAFTMADSTNGYMLNILVIQVQKPLISPQQTKHYPSLLELLCTW